eukprot:TRINITY_DN22358_c0_g1_i1.p1 TRINITY_DN22358_c0_g1~~TRINITY_DN22358_c0_g1_i1.p1  ORF type:complete len:609 (+),score=113.60 TRINITY_DN22358_c0_g1_i1:35-1828(+)
MPVASAPAAESHNSKKTTFRKSQTGGIPREEVNSWTYSRQLGYSVIESARFETFITTIIMLNIIIIVVEANAGATCRHAEIDCAPLWIDVTNIVLLCIYTLEAAVRGYVLRGHVFRRGWDRFDLAIVVMSYVDVIISRVLTSLIPGVQVLRVCRIAKIMRAARIMRTIPELFNLFRGFVSSMSAMFWGFIMMLFFLLMIATMLVEFIQPLSLEVFEEGSMCNEAYNSVFSALLLVFQILVASDGWGDCTLAIIRKSPLTAPFFALSLIVIQMGTTNLILAVVLQQAAEAHEADMESQLREMAIEKRKAERSLSDMCTSIDDNNSGTINLDELIQFHEGNSEMRRVFEVLDIKEEELESLFNLMDKDGSGELSYEELVGCISRADSNDLKRQMMLLKLQIQDVWDRLRGTMRDSISTMEKNVETLVREMVPLARQDSEVHNPPQKSGCGEAKQPWNDDSFAGAADLDCAVPVFTEEKAAERAASERQFADSWKLLHAEAKQHEAKAAWSCPPEPESHMVQLQRLVQLNSELQIVAGNLAAQAERLVQNFPQSPDRLLLKFPGSLRPPLGDGKESLIHLEELDCWEKERADPRWGRVTG